MCLIKNALVFFKKSFYGDYRRETIKINQWFRRRYQRVTLPYFEKKT